MTKQQAQQKVIDLVNQYGVIKAGELVAHDSIRDVVLSDFNIPELCEELVKMGELVEVEYSIPTSNYRLKSLFMPAGTYVNVVNPRMQ